MYVRNWEDFVGVDENGFIVQHNPKLNARGIDLASISSRLGEISATATSTPGTLSGTEGGDLIAYTLTAGQTYSFDYRGAVGGVVDPYLAIFASDLETVVAEDDDGGLGRGSLITYTPTVTGIYYLYATSFYTLDTGDPSIDTGAYTIASWTKEADVPGTTNVLASLPTAASLPLGTYYGNIDAAGDNDYYKIDVVAGQYYSFNLAGGLGSVAEFGTPGDIAATVTLYRANGSVIQSSAPATENNVGYFAQANETIYLRVAGFSSPTGGYTIDVEQVDLSTRDPLESLNWDSANNIPTVTVGGVETAYVYFAPAGQNFNQTAPNGSPMVTYGWNQVETDAVMLALEQYTPITGINYVITTDVNQATFRLLTTANTAGEPNNYGAYFFPQSPNEFGADQGIGVFNVNSGGWDKPGVSSQNLPGDQVSLLQGGYSFAVILHEFGHAHGVAHPHDRGGGSEVMLGVAAATGSLGVYNLNQGVYTVMSYNDAWVLHPDGASSFSIAGIDNGWSGTLGAFDIAVLQARYGVHAHNTGDNVYALTDVADDAFYQTIWDTGGKDTISYGGTYNAQIDLTAATLDYTPTGGGVLSFLYNPQPLGPSSSLVRGGFTIANGVVIENATGGSGNDILLGNAAANRLTGNAGNDILMGREGKDFLTGGAGADTFVFTDLSKDTILDFDSGVDKIDLSAFDLDASDLKLTRDSLFADTNGDGKYDLHIVIFGERVQLADVDFGSASASASAAAFSASSEFGNSGGNGHFSAMRFDKIDFHATDILL